MRFNKGAAAVRGQPQASRNGARDPDHVADTVAEVVELEERARVGMTKSDHLADLITVFAGSMLFVGVHVVWFAVWIGVNLPFIGLEFDPFPFGFLTMVVSLEAIFLSTFVLISQNRQTLHADRRAKVDLEVNVIAEREITKLMQLVADIHKHVNGNHEHDPAIQEMLEETQVSKLVDAADEAEESTA